MKFTVSSRLPAELNANDPCPRSGAVRNPACGGVTEPGNEQPEIHEVPAVERDVLHGALVDHLADRDRRRLDDRRLGDDRDGLGDGADAELEVDGHGPRDRQLDFLRLGLEAAQFALRPDRSRARATPEGTGPPRRRPPCARAPVAFDRATIETPGTMAPCSSVTSPCSVAVDWAAAADASSQTESVHATWAAANALQLLPLIDSLILHLLLSGDRTTQPAWGDAVVRDAKPGPMALELEIREKTARCERSGTATRRERNGVLDRQLDPLQVLPHLVLPVRPVVATKRAPVVQVVGDALEAQRARQVVGV